MNPIELSDRDGDALTITTHAQGVWITCTSGRSEVTVGPILPDALLALLAERGDHDLEHDSADSAVDPAMGAPALPR